MRPRPSERETISPSSSFAEIFAVHSPTFVLARRATSFSRRPPKSSAAIFRSRAGENDESPLPHEQLGAIGRVRVRKAARHGESFALGSTAAR